jgi:hypothetical protein
MKVANPEQRLGRAKNAVSEYFTHKLLVPKIYFDAEWEGFSIPVLAIDRAGVGDVHAVLFIERINLSFSALGANDIHFGGLEGHVAEYIEKLTLLPCQFRYIAIYDANSKVAPYEPSPAVIERTLAPDGIGRIGILGVSATHSEPSVKTAIKPERFRSSKEIIELTDKYVAEHTPNWEVRA